MYLMKNWFLLRKPDRFTVNLVFTMAAWIIHKMILHRFNSTPLFLHFFQRIVLLIKFEFIEVIPVWIKTVTYRSIPKKLRFVCFFQFHYFGGYLKRSIDRQNHSIHFSDFLQYQCKIRLFSVANRNTIHGVLRFIWCESMST